VTGAKEYSLQNGTVIICDSIKEVSLRVDIYAWDRVYEKIRITGQDAMKTGMFRCGVRLGVGLVIRDGYINIFNNLLLNSRNCPIYRI
jgi:hypothetical protein